MRRALFAITVFTCLRCFGEERPTEFVDMNFDGHPDKKVFVSRGGGRNARNETYEIALFNPRTGQYDLNEELSEMGNPTPNANAKTIDTFWRDPKGTTMQKFKWSKKRLVLIEEVRIELQEGGTLTTIKRLKGGKMVVVSKEFAEAQ